MSHTKRSPSDALIREKRVSIQQQLRHTAPSTTLGYYRPDPTAAGRSATCAVANVMKQPTTKESA